MSGERLGFGARLVLFFVLPWRVLLDGALAGRVRRLLGAELTEASAPAPATHAEAPPEADPTPALQILAILQREGRFIDFLQEDVSGFSDEEIGAAARVVHGGCKRGLADYLELEPVRSESEGDSVTLEPGFDATRARVTGNVVGEPPYRGTLAHPGWLVSSITMPAPAKGHDARVVAPAEVELQ